MRTHHWTIWKYGIIVGIIIFHSLASAASGDYPQYTDLYVNDFARVLSGQDAANLQTLLRDLKLQTGIEAVVLTISSIADYNTGDATIEAFATNLFNTWGIGDAQKNNGALILVAVRDRKMRIELGAGYGHAYDAAMQAVIDQHMLPAFKRGKYSRGIYQGARHDRQVDRNHATGCLARHDPHSRNRD